MSVMSKNSISMLLGECLLPLVSGRSSKFHSELTITDNECLLNTESGRLEWLIY